MTSKHSFEVTAFWLDYEGPNESESLAKPYRGEREESEREGTRPVLVIGLFYTKRRRSSCYVATFNDCLLLFPRIPNKAGFCNYASKAVASERICPSH